MGTPNGGKHRDGQRRHGENLLRASAPGYDTPQCVLLYFIILVCHYFKRGRTNKTIINDLCVQGVPTPEPT